MAAPHHVRPDIHPEYSGKKKEKIIRINLDGKNTGFGTYNYYTTKILLFTKSNYKA
jgi:hypothetical protein